MKCIFVPVIMSIIVSFLKSEERFQSSIIRYHVSCRVFTNVLHQIEGKIPSVLVPMVASQNLLAKKKDH